MRRKCHTCICRTCLNVCCDRKKCSEKKELCENYCGFRQLSIFDQPQKPQYRSVPRYSWEHYGISKERYKQLTEYIQSGRYASIASQAAHTANAVIAEYLIKSVTENKSYDVFRVKWDLKEMEKIPYGRTDFYGIRRYFFSIFDKELVRIGK